MSTLHELIKYGFFFGGKGSGGSGGGTQPDWNQNDPTKADYVKSRTHWIGETGSNVLFDGVVANEDEISVNLVAGQEYEITLDGDVYVLTAVDDRGEVYVGAESLWCWEYVAGDLPFCLSDGWFATVKEGEQHNLKIIEVGEEVHRISRKYMPKNVVYSGLYGRFLATPYDLGRAQYEYFPEVMFPSNNGIYDFDVPVEQWSEFYAFCQCIKYREALVLYWYNFRELTLWEDIEGHEHVGVSGPDYVDFKYDRENKKLTVSVERRTN